MQGRGGRPTGTDANVLAIAELLPGAAREPRLGVLKTPPSHSPSFDVSAFSIPQETTAIIA